MEAQKSTVTTGGPSVKGICYVEVNNYSIANVGDYTLAQTGGNLFDVGIIFAANINLDPSTNQAGLFLNPNVQNTLSNYETNIAPLQQKGIKVSLSVLGNHQGVGIANFETEAAAQTFAQILCNAVTTYKLDGVDFDDEYADYPSSGPGVPNANSFPWLLTAIRSIMPELLISFYAIGPAYEFIQSGTTSFAGLLNYAWNPYYGSYSAPQIPGLTNSVLSPAAVEINATDAQQAAQFATETISQNYGLYLYYNLPDSDSSSYLSNISQALYGEGTTYTA